MTRARIWLLAVIVVAVLATGAFMFWQWNANRAPEATSATSLGSPTLVGAHVVVTNREPLFYWGAEFIEGLGSRDGPSS